MPLQQKAEDTLIEKDRICPLRAHQKKKIKINYIHFSVKIREGLVYLTSELETTGKTEWYTQWLEGQEV